MTDQKSINQRVKQVIVSTLELAVDPADIPDDEVLFGEGLGAPSVATLEVVCALEEEFGFEVDDDDLRLELFESVKSITEYVEQRLLHEVDVHLFGGK